MASNPNKTERAGTVNEVVSAALPGGTGSSGLAEQFARLADQFEQLQTVSEAQTESLQANTQALSENTGQVGGTGPSTASQVGSALQSTLGLATGLSPLITGLLSLFGGGGSSQPAELTRFELPPSMNVNAGISEAAPTQAFGADFMAGGEPRPVAGPGATQGATPVSTATSSATQITVQVQALDSQSFLDRSQDIALAVRQAMLQSSVLNDVIQEAVS
ncbi:MAG TPA: hypothetical protein VKV74_00210 [Bryobacteraceae bacterium]|nr:hypothetical protein [Bryobacteraceae bacterium]